MKKLLKDAEYGYYNRKLQKQCDKCNGHGFTEERLMVGMREVKAMVDAGLGDLPVPIERQRCKKCHGSGGFGIK